MSELNKVNKCYLSLSPISIYRTLLEPIINIKLLLCGPKKSLSEKLDVLDLPEVYLWLMCPKLKKAPRNTCNHIHWHPHTDTHTQTPTHVQTYMQSENCGSKLISARVDVCKSLILTLGHKLAKTCHFLIRFLIQVPWDLNTKNWPMFFAWVGHRKLIRDLGLAIFQQNQTQKEF